MKWLITGVVFAVGGCSALQEVADLSGLEPAAVVTVVDQRGEAAKCVWSSKLRVVSCPELLLQGRVSGTGAAAPSEIPPSAPAPGGD